MVDDSADTATVSTVLAHDVIPRINLSKASRKQISTALDYLIKQPGTLLKGVSVATASSRIESAPRKYWKTLDPITKLGCKLSKNTLKELNKIFYLEPEPLPEVITDRSLLETFTTADLKKMARKQGLKGYAKFKKTELVDALAE
ncbi:Rho termination factor N-terminal domain-containing protein [Leptothoe sp. PORK10 BA2]|uniref:Rho termination factor N-terminal domain-containing protein n=1 Tax=Leptothoe sp. PORK10 BA2 TaxID=3110254 RepID=UPI002B21905D|nr:Rho termination factor N-terminal domain-containing protein [Leptothoe sp. PORK10 BA2]MEA5464282.1 Rho termination factor N-terminal domain-containing protein [Leptothoe sp. PORK10 BA2]